MERDDPPSDDFEERMRRQYPALRVVPSENETRAAGPPDRQSLDEWVTPTDELFVLNHYPTPDVDGDEWTLTLSGAVDGESTLSLATLREEFPETTVAHTMECAGNGRAFFDSRDGLPEGLVQWRDEAVGNALWTGVPVSAVLEAHDADGSWLTAIGGDAPEGEEVFARSIPMEKAMDDCVLAYAVNDDPLPPEHGYPCRLVVPWWYGVNSVKWLTELRVMDRMMAGLEWEQFTRWQQRGYRLTSTVDEDATEYESVDTFDIASQFEAGIDQPYTYNQNVMSLLAVADGATLTPREDGAVELPGMAWAGDHTVERVEVSLDGGETWDAAEFARPPQRGTWRPFRYLAEVPPGEYRLVTRATDDAGRTQPARVAAPDEGRPAGDDVYPWNPEGYGNNAYLPYGVTVDVLAD